MANINSRILFVHLLQSTVNKHVQTQPDAFPVGSICSYQLADMEPGFEVIGSFDVTSNITLGKESQHDIDHCIFPPFPLVASSQAVISPDIITQLNGQQKKFLMSLLFQLQLLLSLKYKRGSKDIVKTGQL